MSGSFSLSTKRYKPEMGTLAVPRAGAAPCHAERPAHGARQPRRGQGCPRHAGTPTLLASSATCSQPEFRDSLRKRKNPQLPPRGQQPGSPAGEETSPLSTSPRRSIGLSPALPCPHRDTRLLDTGMTLFPLLKLNFVLVKYSLGYTGEEFCTLVVRGLI